MDEETDYVLIVDDTPKDLQFLIEHLEKEAGLNVLIAKNGRHALEITQKIVPNLILMDVLMEGIDGFETCRQMKQHAALKDVPIIFITGLVETANIIKGFAAGGVDYITKPFQTEEVYARINTHLTINRQQRLLAQKNEALTNLNEQLKQEISHRQEVEGALQTADAKLSAIYQSKETESFSTLIGKSQVIDKILDCHC